MSIERCDICDEPTGGAGRLDDSVVCANCNRVICCHCQADFGEVVICKQCAAKAFGIPLDRLEAICAAEREGRVVVLPCKRAMCVEVSDPYSPTPCRMCILNGLAALAGDGGEVKG